MFVGNRFKYIVVQWLNYVNKLDNKKGFNKNMRHSVRKALDGYMIKEAFEYNLRGH